MGRRRAGLHQRDPLSDGLPRVGPHDTANQDDGTPRGQRWPSPLGRVPQTLGRRRGVAAEGGCRPLPSKGCVGVGPVSPATSRPRCFGSGAQDGPVHSRRAHDILRPVLHSDIPVDQHPCRDRLGQSRLGQQADAVRFERYGPLQLGSSTGRQGPAESGGAAGSFRVVVDQRMASGLRCSRRSVPGEASEPADNSDSSRAGMIDGKRPSSDIAPPSRKLSIAAYAPERDRGAVRQLHRCWVYPDRGAKRIAFRPLPRLLAGKRGCRERCARDVTITPPGPDAVPSPRDEVRVRPA